MRKHPADSSFCCDPDRVKEVLQDLADNGFQRSAVIGRFCHFQRSTWSLIIFNDAMKTHPTILRFLTFLTLLTSLSLLTSLTPVTSSPPHESPRRDYASYVNPFIGASTNIGKAGVAHGLGKTFPGAATPFGLVQVSPNTITGGDNGPGYSYEHTTIEGFAFTQMSGIGWYGDLGNFLVMPATGPLRTNSGKEDPAIPGYRSKYGKSSEQANAGYYSVQLSDYKIKVEATAAPHSGMLRFTFPENKLSRIQIDLARRVGGTAIEQYVKVADPTTIQGWMRCTADGGGWGNGGGKPNYTVYFYAQFSKPLIHYGVWSAKIPEGTDRRREFEESKQYQKITADAEIVAGCTEKQGKNLGFYTEFPTSEGEVVVMKAGISFVSIEGAKKNLEADITGWDFDQVVKNTRELWNQALGKIKIEGGSDEEKVVFYTALYHTMIDPRAFADVDGKYPGGDGKIKQTGNSPSGRFSAAGMCSGASFRCKPLSIHR